MSYDGYGPGDQVGTFATVAEFETPEQLIAAAVAARHAGFKKMDA